MRNILIAGLGNPGKKYEKTRHNTGFMFVDYFWGEFCEEFGFSDWEFNKKIFAPVAAGRSGRNKIILTKPETFMNQSGKSALAAKRFYKIKLENILIVHDEIDLPLGSYKFSTNRSSAGHKGVQDIIDKFKSKNFERLRIGIGRKKNSLSSERKVFTEEYVLNNFSAAEFSLLQKVFEVVSSALRKKLE